MSALTSEVRNARSPVTRWLRATFPHHQDVQADYREGIGPARVLPASTVALGTFPPGNGGRSLPEPSVAYTESLTGALYLDRPEELAAYVNVWKRLTALALDEGQSANLISALISEARDD